MPHVVQIKYQKPVQSGTIGTVVLVVSGGAEAHVMIAAILQHGCYYVAPGDLPGVHTIIPLHRIVEVKEIIT